MQTILGPFHPYLENAVVDEILKYKKEDLLYPLLILVPSDSLRRRLKLLLARERGLPLLNVPILTFHQLAAKLFAERGGGKPAILRDDLFLEEVVRQIVRARQPGAAAFAGIEERAGGSGALWQTLRDLRDAKLEPEVALEALREGQFSAKTSSRTADLLRLQQTLRDFCLRKGIEDHADLDQRATERALSSSFLALFRQIFYYGFYDLTQVQVDFFHAVARHFPTTLFFPLLESRPGHDGWSFAERFFERYVQGLSISNVTNLIEVAGLPLPATFRLFDEAAERSYGAPPDHWRVTISNAFGVDDEVDAAAKEIVRLASDGAMRFDEIGVVARGLEGYGATIKKIFHAHQIPIRGAIEESLAQFPLTHAAILLLNLPAKDFLRSQVIDLLSSPHFRLDAVGLQGIRSRPDLWDLATRELAICKGISEWRRLRNYQTGGLAFSQYAGDEEARQIRIGAEQIRALADLSDALAADLTGLPARASWSGYAGRWCHLFKKYLGIDAEIAASEASDEQLVRRTILGVLEQIAGLDALDEEVSLAGFSETFQRWLEHASVTAQPDDVPGVTVVSATAARGLPFRSLFVLGMNEGVFPRTIREDAFLRDRDREILERDLGYKINQKLAAFDEEKLLFTLLVGAARERLYLSFQRADDSGRALTPSWYLNDLKRALGSYALGHLKEITIPRSVTDKSEVEPFTREDLLLPEELAIRLSLDGQDPTSLVEACALAPNLYKPGRKVVAELDRSTERLHAFDGFTGPLIEYWNHISRRGLSPTALETYARCPFQFFANHVLRLERLDCPEESMGPSLGEFGELGHEILKVFYQHLSDNGFFAGKSGNLDNEATIEAIARSIFAQYEAKHPVGYPLAWENVKDTLAQLLGQVITADLRELAASGFVPIGFELDGNETLSSDWPKPLAGMAIHGRMDRIDRNPAENRLRVIDYKFKFGAQPSTADKNLYRSALRGQKLQPPFYSLLGRRAAGDATRSAPPQVEAKFYYIAPRWREGPLVTESFGADGLSGQVGAEIRNTMTHLADGIREGRFFIQRGEYCAHCDVAEICRKNHPPSLWRAENDPVTAPHRELRGKDLKKL